MRSAPFSFWRQPSAFDAAPLSAIGTDLAAPPSWQTAPPGAGWGEPRSGGRACPPTGGSSSSRAAADRGAARPRELEAVAQLKRWSFARSFLVRLRRGLTPREEDLSDCTCLRGSRPPGGDLRGLPRFGQLWPACRPASWGRGSRLVRGNPEGVPRPLGRLGCVFNRKRASNYQF